MENKKTIYPQILIADDDNTFRLMLKEYLTNSGFNITEAASGKETLNLITENDYSIVLLDVRFEDIDGIELLKRIRKISPDTEVIIITAYADIGIAVDSIRHGARDFIAKPIEAENLCNKIKQYLRIRTEEKKLLEIHYDFPTFVMQKLITPVSTAISAVSLLNKGIDQSITSNQLDLLSHIDNTLKKIKATINDLVDLAQLESGKTQLEKLPTNLDELVPAVCSQFESAARKKNINLTLTIDKNVPTIEIDLEKIEKVLINLLDNAIQYTPPLGQINVSTTTIHKDYNDTIRQYVEVSVSDTGIGIEENLLPQIFKKYKLDLPKQEKTTGLGLALCKLIVEAHDGFIVAESTVNKGSTFRFALPVEISML